MINPEVTPMSRGGAQDFYGKGMEQLNHLLLGETDAKEATLVAIAAGLNNVLVGHPGGGKTTLGEDSYRLIGDIDAEQVAVLPLQADLQPQQITGGEARTSKVTTVEGKDFEEESRVAISSLFNEDTKVIFANEINRVNPMAVNAMLEVLESGKLDSTGGRRIINLEYATSTMNPAEKRQGVFPMAAAVASRHAIGVELGADDRNGERDSMINEVLGGWEPQPHAISSVISLADLQALRARVNDPKSVAFQDDLKAVAVQAVKGTHEALKGLKIFEADARLAKQLGRVARTLAVLHGRDAVLDVDLEKATQFIVGARIGILGTNGEDTNARKITKTIFNK